MMTDARTSGFHWNLGGKEGDERIRRENARERERGNATEAIFIRKDW